MKKKIIAIVVIIIALILLFPIPMRLKDGGSVEYRALLYTITKYHSLSANPNQMYIDGWGIEILGMEIYNGIKEQENEVKSADEFELIFNARKDLGIKTVISKEETDKYSYNIYTYGGDVKIKIDGTEYDLKEALLNNKITMEEIIAKANKDFPNAISYDDGGSKEYHYEDYSILKCHTIDGNRDVYIGVPYMRMNDVL